MNVPAELRASKLSYDPPSNSRPTRIAWARPMLKSTLSATSSVREEPWLFTPAPPLLNVSMTLIEGPLVSDDASLAWRLNWTRTS